MTTMQSDPTLGSAARQTGTSAGPRRGLQGFSRPDVKMSLPRRRPQPARKAGAGLAKGLGVFSLALGAAELIMPGLIARGVGLDRAGSLVRFYGLREIGAGIPLLLSAKAETHRPWLWSRIAGDAVDIATLAPALSPTNARRPIAMIAMAAVLAVTALDIAAVTMLRNSR